MSSYTDRLRQVAAAPVNGCGRHGDPVSASEPERHQHRSRYQRQHGWHDKFRGRAYFKPVSTEDQDEDASGLRALEFLKNNFGPSGDSIAVRWRDGVFVPVGNGAGALDRLAAEQHADIVFLGLLDRYTREGRNVTSKSGTAYAPKLFSLEPEAKGIGKDALDAAMRRLFAADKLHLITEGPPSRQRSRLISAA